MRYFQVYSRFQPPQTFIRPPRDSEHSVDDYLRSHPEIPAVVVVHPKKEASE